MTKLTDFKPLSVLELPGAGEIKTDGLILIVGPNSSGKSQLLRDIYHRLAGDSRNLVVANKIKVADMELESLISCLKSEGYLYSLYNDDGVERLRPMTTFGTGEAAAELDPNQSKAWYQTHKQLESSPRKRRSEFLAYFGKMLVTQLFLERRLSALSAVSTIDFENSSPQHDLHALYLNNPAREELLNEVRASFAKAIWPDISRGNVLCMRISSDDKGELPSAEDRLDPRKMRLFRTIETEGDGFKSYVATCVALLLNRRPVCLLDEPELCLHPPQALSLGRFIGRYGASDASVTLVSTHSSEILRGAIQAQSNIQIIRLIRQNGGFHAHLVPAPVLQAALARPTVRAESVLDGIFSQAVVLVEADTDRTVYEAVWEALLDEFNNDIHFSAVGGIGGFADTRHLYCTLNIPSAVIADLDLLTKIDTLERILKSSIKSEETVDRLYAEARGINSIMRTIPPTISADEVRGRLIDISASAMNWSNGDDARRRNEVLVVARELDRMARVKAVGVNGFEEPFKQRLKNFLESLAHEGIFLVPVGELESWLSTAEIKASRKKKWNWANEAASFVRSHAPEEHGIWEFVRSIATYLFPS